MIKSIRKILKNLFSFIGIEVSRTGSGILGGTEISTRSEKTGFKLTPSEEDKFRWIQNMNIRTVIDVGAHTGESTLEFYKLFPDADIYAFEPLHELNANFKDMPTFKSFNLALGERQGKLDIHRSEYS